MNFRTEQDFNYILDYIKFRDKGFHALSSMFIQTGSKVPVLPAEHLQTHITDSSGEFWVLGKSDRSI